MPKGLEHGSYRITFGSFTGEVYGVHFFDGVGVLCKRSMEAWRSDWFKVEDGESIQFRGAPMSEYVRFFRDKGAEVKEISEEEALALMDEQQFQAKKLASKLAKEAAKPGKTPDHPEFTIRKASGPGPGEPESKTGELEEPAEAEDVADQPHEKGGVTVDDQAAADDESPQPHEEPDETKAKGKKKKKG